MLRRIVRRIVNAICVLMGVPTDREADLESRLQFLEVRNENLRTELRDLMRGPPVASIDPRPLVQMTVPPIPTDVWEADSDEAWRRAGFRPRRRAIPPPHTGYIGRPTGHEPEDL